MANGRIFTPEYKAKIALEVERGEKTASEIGQREGVAPKLLNTWRRELEQNAHRAFSLTKDEKTAQNQVLAAQEREESLMAKIGQLTFELDWLKKKSERAGIKTESRNGGYR